MLQSEYILGMTNQHFKEKQQHKLEHQFNVEQALLNNTNYSDVYYKLKKASIALEKAIYNNETDKIQQLSQDKEQLEKQRAMLKAKISVPNGNQQFSCKVCDDNGELPSGEYCHCFYEEITNQAYLFLKTKRHNLSSFDDDKLSKVNDLTRIYKYFYNYAETFSLDKQSILFLGQCGTGKTFLASEIATKIAEKNFNVLFFTAIEFNQIMLDFHIAPNADKKIYSDILSTCDLLVIDDLGTEPIYKNVTIEYLLSILNERLALKRPTIITSNLQPDSLAIRYGERIFSRIAGNNFIKQNFQGKDLRLTKY